MLSGKYLTGKINTFLTSFSEVTNIQYSGIIAIIKYIAKAKNLQNFLNNFKMLNPFLL